MAASIAAGATAIATALTAVSVRSTQDPRYFATATGAGAPIVVIMGNGSDNMAGLGKVGIPYSYRLVCVAKTLAKSTASVAALRTLVATVLAAMRDLAGFAVVSLGPESQGSFAGGSYLAAEIIVQTYVSV